MKWWIVVARPGEEFAVVEYMRLRGVEAYCPARRKWISPRRKRKGFFKTVAAFPRYAFVLQDARAPSLGEACPAVAFWVRAGEMLAEVTDAQVCAIRTLEESGWFDDAAPGSKRFRLLPGDVFEVCEGPMTGLSGPAQEVVDEARPVVRLLLSGWKVDLPLSILRKIRHKG